MKFRQIGLYVSDIVRATNFYSQIIGKNPTAEFPAQGFAFFDLEGVRLFLDVNAPKSAVYLEVSDVRETAENLRNKGVNIVNEPHIVFPDSEGVFDKPGIEWLAFFEDSEGNLVGIMSRESITK